MKPRTLRTQIVLWSLCVHGVLLIGFGIAILFVFDKLQSNQIDASLRLGGSQLASEIDLDRGRLVILNEDAELLAGQGLFAWAINAENVSEIRIGRATRIALPTLTSEFQTISINGENLRLYRQYAETFNGTLIVGVSLAEAQRTTSTIMLLFAIAVPLTLLLSSGGSFFLAHRTLQPIASITAQAQRISQENLSERLGFSESRDEVGELAATFDAMLDRLQAAFDSERRFISDASHELRTPLGLLKAQISLALNRPRDMETLRQMMQAMDRDVDRMTRLVETMLRLSRTESTTIDMRRIDLGDLLAGLVAQLQSVANPRKLTLSLVTPIDATVQGDRDQLVQLFLNLLDNALKYTPDAGTISVRIQRVDRIWQVTIQDTGVGIDPSILNHLFERFYRADSSRARQTGGVGLGLAIAQAIARQHGGRITVQSRLGEGSTFVISLPADL